MYQNKNNYERSDSQNDRGEIIVVISRFTPHIQNFTN